MTINCIHTTTRGALICFQTIVLYGCSFTNGYDVNTLRISSFSQHSVDRRRVFTREGLFSVHNSHLWARDNPHAIRERGYRVRFSVSLWAGIVGDIVVGSYLLPDRLTDQRYRDCLETVLPGLTEGVPLALRQRLWFHDDGAPALALWRWRPAVVEEDISIKVDWTWRTDFMAPSDARSNSDCMFPVGTPEGTNFHSPSQDYRRSRSKASSSCDSGRCQHIKACSRECLAAHCHCLEMKGGRFENLL
jgi:hypothetical protein